VWKLKAGGGEPEMTRPEFFARMQKRMRRWRGFQKLRNEFHNWRIMLSLQDNGGMRVACHGLPELRTLPPVGVRTNRSYDGKTCWDTNKGGIDIKGLKNAFPDPLCARPHSGSVYIPNR